MSRKSGNRFCEKDMLNQRVARIHPRARQRLERLRDPTTFNEPRREAGKAVCIGKPRSRRRENVRGLIDAIRAAQTCARA